MSKRWTTADLDKAQGGDRTNDNSSGEEIGDKQDNNAPCGSIEAQERDFILCHLEKHGSLPVGAKLEHNKSFEGVITWKGKVHTLKLN